MHQIMKRIVPILLITMLSGAISFNSKLLLASPIMGGTPVMAAFTFQGQLKTKDGLPINNTCTFTFSLWDSASGGSQVGADQVAEAIPVVNGFFTTELNFNNQFVGEARWIAIRAQCNGDDAETEMEKRILLTASPYAIGLIPGAEINTTGERGLTVNANGNAIVGVGTKDTFAAIFGDDQSAEGGYGIYGTSKKGPGVYGISDEYSGVRGISSGEFQAGVVGIHKGSGYGIYGTSLGTGVFGVSEEWVGVYGQSTSYRGVSGKSTSGTGVAGISEEWVGVYGESMRHDAILGVSKGKGKAGVVGISETDGVGVYGEGRNGGTGVYGRSQNDADFAIYADGKMGAKEVHILGGADLAEWYNVNGPVTPGTLMVIDEVNAGMLKASAYAYDSKVAGIVSGAGGVNPGLTLQQQGVLDGNTQVAIAGRVYVHATAVDSPILPGDLLTTSNVPGHAMKVTDRVQAYGAVIGKAMTGLESGEGLVLVLVNLQ